MKKIILTTLAILTIGMAIYATTFMRVKTSDGNIVRYDVENVVEIDFEDENIPQVSTDTITSDYTYVDLGLTSGTLWATCNIGATKPEENGDYFAWGETKPKDVYDWSTYKYAQASGAWDLDSLTKYNFGNYVGVIDSLSVLLPEDDAATANWGSEWRMPTSDEQKELVEECHIEWTNDYNGSNVKGIIVYKAKSAKDKGMYVVVRSTSSDSYSTSDAHVFFPVTGYRYGSGVILGGELGYYWSSSLVEEDEDNARHLDFNERNTDCFYYDRSLGFPVRAVRAQKIERKTYSVSFYTSDSVLIESQKVVEGADAKEVKAPAKEGYEFVGWSTSFVNVTSDISVYALYEAVSTTDTTSHTFVDLGLTSGTLWATCNIGATKPEEYGDYFAWGETEPKEVYDTSNFKYGVVEHSDVVSLTKYNFGNKLGGVIDSISTLLPEDDAATANWGSEWRMPTIDEQKELMDECYMVWTDNYKNSDVSGVIFYKAKSSSDKGTYITSSETPSSEYSTSTDAHLFFPAAGCLMDSFLYHMHAYWSSSLYEKYGHYAHNLHFGSKISCNKDIRGCGYPVRAVLAKK